MNLTLKTTKTLVKKLKARTTSNAHVSFVRIRSCGGLQSTAAQQTETFPVKEVLKTY